jgi:hypothetical protein
MCGSSAVCRGAIEAANGSKGRRKTDEAQCVEIGAKVTVLKGVTIGVNAGVPARQTKVRL